MPADSMRPRPLGSSGMAVSAMSLGSWRTFEYLPPETGAAILAAARDEGINFFDDARYNDETGRAPLPTGYSEVLFGELFRGAGVRRDEVVVANKLWWEFWPEQSAAQEIEASLERMGMDHIDLGYAAEPPEGLTVQRLVGDVTDLIKAGKLRAWGVLNWPAALIAEAAKAASELGVPGPCASQLPYNLVIRSPVEDGEMVQALQDANVSVVASYTLHGGALTGKYETPGAEGRLVAGLDKRDYSKALIVGRELIELAGAHKVRPATLAVAFALANPRVASVLFGATRPEQIDENLRALELIRSPDQTWLDDLRRIVV
jgi:aryl-alcohol dehydrogenase-like predicted oxidoreductase